MVFSELHGPSLARGSQKVERTAVAGTAENGIPSSRGSLLAHLVAREHVTRAFPGARSDEPKRTCRPASQRRRAPRAQHDRADHQGQLIDQTVGRQFVQERAAAEDQDVLSGLALEFGDSSARSRT